MNEARAVEDFRSPCAKNVTNESLGHWGPGGLAEFFYLMHLSYIIFRRISVFVIITTHLPAHCHPTIPWRTLP